MAPEADDGDCKPDLKVEVVGLPSWLSPALPAAILVVESRSMQFNKRSCMSAVVSQLKAVRPRAMPLRALQVATEYDAAEIGSCLVKLQQDGRVGKNAPPLAMKNGATYYWAGDDDRN